MQAALQHWRTQTPSAAYVHIPFCSHRCGYCNFAVAANREDQMERYIECLEREMAALRVPRQVDTIFIGGGTPTLLPPPLLRRLLKSIRRWLPPAANCEWSIEANPADVNEDLCKLLTDAGVNRVSVGCQSFQDEKLQSLDRRHTAAQAIAAIELALQTFPKVSADLIFAAPGETLDDWQRDLQSAVRLGVSHVSTYSLTIEKGTRFFALRSRGELMVPPEECEAAMYTASIEILADGGLDQYEVSNFARSDAPCRHNLAYWSARGWWAFGAGAARNIGAVRSVNHASTSRYMQLIEEGKLPLAERLTLTHAEWTIDRFVFGMRLLCGVDLAVLRAEGDAEMCQGIERLAVSLIEVGLMTRQTGCLQLTRRGLMISDSLWPRFYRLL